MNNRIAIIRESTSRITKMLAEKNIEITQRGTQAMVEYDHTGKPTRVNIPFIPDDASDELIDAIQGYVDHEVAHVLFTDYSVLMAAKEEKIKQLHNIIEDSFIERKMAERFTGSSLNLRNVGSFYLRTFVDVEMKKHPDHLDGVLLVPAIRAWAGQPVFQEYMLDKWHHMQKLTDRLSDAVLDLPNCKTSKDCLDVAIKFKNLLSAPEEPETPPEESQEGKSSDENKDKSEPNKDSDSKEKENNPKPDEDQQDDSDKEEEPESEKKDQSEEDGDEKEDRPESTPSKEEGTESDEGGDDEDFSSSENPDEQDEDGFGDDADDSDMMPSVPSDKRSNNSEESDEKGDSSDKGVSKPGSKAPVSDPTLLDELLAGLSESDFDEAVAKRLSDLAEIDTANSDYRIYTTDMDKIEEMKTHSFRDYMLKKLQDDVDHMVAPLQKDLERAVAARSASAWQPGHRSGRLHSSQLSRLVAFNDSRVFRRKQVATNKDVAVSLLVDCSGSMGGGSKIETAAYAAYGLCAVLDRMNISNEVLGFTTIPQPYSREMSEMMEKYTRCEAIYIPIIKSFGERLVLENKKRFALLPEASFLTNNIDGESVRIAASRLSARKETRKILIVLSDGDPAAYTNDTAGLRRHLKDAVTDIEKSGIDVLGIGIESTAVERFYSKYLTLNSVSELPKAVIGEMKNLLMK